jgi:hypothetical protein
MPNVDVTLTESELELLGIDKQALIEEALAMLAEVALGGAAEQALLPPPGQCANPASDP